ncbi:MAG: tripartite tricarboxylate transporter substrate-binding protein [Pseudomonadota bacterium]
MKTIVAVAAALLSLAGAAAHAAYPDRPIRLMVPFAAAGESDSMARIIAEKISIRLGQPILIENKPGGDTRIATEMVAKSAPDGYTMLMVSVNFAAVNKALYPNLPYNQKTDFTPVVQLASAPSMFVVSTTLGVHSFKEFIDKARRNPGKLNYGTSSSTVLVYDKEFQSLMGFSGTQIPFKGMAPALQSLAAGDIQYTWGPPASIAPILATGRIMALATTGKTRMKQFPNVPTIYELGVPELADTRGGWWGILAPAGTPKEIVDRWNAAANEALQMPDVRTKLATIEMTPEGGKPEELGGLIDRQLTKFQGWIVKHNIKPD